jgi:outer membrane protein assembly factor BamB
MSLVTFMLSACASSTGDKEPASLTKIQTQGTLSKLWSVSNKKAKHTAFSPQCTTTECVSIAYDGTIKRNDARTGQNIATIKTNLAVAAGIAYNGEYFYFATTKSTLVAVDHSGQQVWKNDLSALATEPPVLVGDTLIVRTNDARYTAYDAKQGQLRWTQLPDASPLMIRPVTPTILKVNDQQFLAPQTGALLQAFQINNPKPLASFSLAGVQRGSDLDRISELVSRPAYDASTLCAIAYQGKIACFDLASGRVKWSKNESGVSGVSIANQTVLTTNTDGTILAFDMNTGDLIWKTDALKYRKPNAPVLLNGALLIVDAEGYAHMLKLRSGELIARLDVDSDAHVAQPLVVGDIAYIQTSDKIIALSYQP